MDNICNFCNKEFSNKVNLIQHQKTVKSCLKLQGKQEDETTTQCTNCNKILAVRSYKQHKIKCDLVIEEKNKNQDYLEKTKLYNELLDKYKILETQSKKLKSINNQYELELKKLKAELEESRSYNEKIKMELVEYKTTISLLERQNEKLQSISTSITMKLAEKTTTVNNNQKTLVISTPLTNDVLRQCAESFSIDNAYNINGITKHLTSSLEEHVKCTDAARNIFKYVNEKDEEIVDQDLEILIPQYLTALKDRNNFLYKEVFEYFKKNNVSLNVQTDYRVFYEALNSIIEKTGQQDKYTEKCKQYMVRECKRQFLEKNKNKEKEITKKLSTEEVMNNIIETGGSLNDFLIRFFPDNYDDETDEQFNYRREMEDIFREKKKNWLISLNIS
jgi:hypothetical protein